MQRRSLFRHILAWTLGALLAVWSGFMAIGYRAGVHEADELTDGHLASVASVLVSQQSFVLRMAPGAVSIGDMHELKAHDYQQSLSIVVWDAAGKVLSHSGEAPVPPFTAGEGFETAALGSPPAKWRTFSRWDGADHARKVTVMLSLEERDGLAQDIAGQVATPGLWLLPVAALVLVFAIRRGLRPLLDLSDEVDQLDVHRAITFSAPPLQEFKAIEASINTLMERYNAALLRERELASEIAHELRTPLASLRLHAASLGNDLPPQELASVREQVTHDAERAGAVLNDLLALARASRTQLAEARQPVELAELARRVAAEFGQRALDAGHELSVEAPQACPVSGHVVILDLALRNLIENAIAHTPCGSHVRVRVQAHPAMLEVIDDGSARGERARAGGPPGQLGQLGQVGHLGLGLGHQLVRRVAEIHGGHFASLDLPGGERSYRIVFAPAS